MIYLRASPITSLKNHLIVKDLFKIPKCSSCNKVFKNWQVLGNHIKKYFDDSDEDIPLPNQLIHRISQNLVETST